MRLSRRLKVLLLEDRPDKPGSLGESLNKLNGRPFTLSLLDTTAETIDRTATQRFDVTLVHCGSFDEQTVNLIEELYNHVVWRPIVVVSDRVEDADTEKAIRCGADDFLVSAKLSAGDLAKALVYSVVRTSRNRERAGIPSTRSSQPASSGVMDRLPMGVILVNTEGHVLLANRMAQEIAATHDGFMIDENGQCHASRVDETRALLDLIKKVSDAPSDEIVQDSECALTLTRPSMKQPLVLLVAPVGSGTNTIKKGRGAAIFISDPEDSSEISPDVLSELYELTHAESRVVKGLCEGQRIELLADDLGVAANTVRHQLKQIFRKTGTTRQSELIKMVLTGPAAIRAERRSSDSKPRNGAPERRTTVAGDT